MRWIPALVLAAGLCAAGDASPPSSPHLEARAHFRLALKCEANNKPAAARDHYLAVLRLEPDHRAAQRALRGGGRALADAALRLLRSGDPARRALGLRVIGLLAPAERQRALRIASRHPRAEVRLRAVHALRDPAALVRAAVRDFDVEIASTAFIADPEVGVVQDGLAFAFRALGHSGTVDIHERRAVVAALRKLTGKELRTPAAWLAWYSARRTPPAQGSDPNPSG